MGTLVAVLADYWRPGWRAGGPITSLTRLVDRTECSSVVLTRDHDLGVSDPYPGVVSNAWTSEPRAKSTVGYLSGWTGLRWASRELRKGRPALLHVNSLHSPAFGILPLLGARLGLLHYDVLLITPHGELASSAQQHKRWKKVLARPLLRRLIPRAAIWHASSTYEAGDIAAWLKRDPTVVIAPDLAPAPQPSPSPGPGTPTVLFASRIHPIKGLDTAIEIMASLRKPCRFVVAGQPEDADYWASCSNLLSRLPANIDVDIRGAYSPDEVAALMDDSTVLLLPTHGENFGQVIAEALASGCPVAIPPTTPWGEYVGDVIGCIAADSEALAKFIVTVIGETREQRLLRRAAVLDAYRSWFTSNESRDLYSEVLLLAEATR